jgi:hypothetical protein
MNILETNGVCRATAHANEVNVQIFIAAYDPDQQFSIWKLSLQP